MHNSNDRRHTSKAPFQLLFQPPSHSQGQRSERVGQSKAEQADSVIQTVRIFPMNPLPLPLVLLVPLVFQSSSFPNKKMHFFLDTKFGLC